MGSEGDAVGSEGDAVIPFREGEVLVDVTYCPGERVHVTYADERMFALRWENNGAEDSGYSYDDLHRFCRSAIGHIGDPCAFCGYARLPETP